MTDTQAPPVLKSILAATDRSPGGRHAVRAARRVASVTRAHLAIVSVQTVGPAGPVPAGRLLSSQTAGRHRASPELAELQDWLAEDGSPTGPGDDPELAVGFGVPGIEIGRFAAVRSADLIVLGRRPRTPEHRLVLGETGDALVRRSGTPILFVPPEVAGFDHLLLALDATERSAEVARVGMAFAKAVGAKVVEAVTVRPRSADAVPGASVLPTRRPVRLDAMLQRASADATEVGPVPLTIRQGDPIEEVLAEAGVSGADLLVIGYRRGGPPKYVSPTEIARNLLYAAPCAILTVPL